MNVEQMRGAGRRRDGALGMIVAVAVLAAGCASRPARSPAPDRTSGVTGSRADLTTAPGEADGYAVEWCSGEDCVGVSGRGRQSFAASHALDAGGDNRDPFFRFRDELLRALAGVSSIHTSGFARKCGSGRLFVEMFDWRQTDAAVAAAAHFLRTGYLSDAVAICVSPRHKDVLLGSKS
jgi:hypothetical protein